MFLILKFCGIRRKEDVEYLNILKPTMAGFIFAQSPRKLNLNEAEELLKEKCDAVKSVGVFQNQDIQLVSDYSRFLNLDYIQLHGDEDIKYTEKLKEKGFRVIKAFQIRNKSDLVKVLPFYNLADYILLDRPKGEKFDIIELVKDFKYPYIIAGGITLENIERFLSLNPLGIDISSGVEVNGFKDFQKMKKISEKVGEMS